MGNRQSGVRKPVFYKCGGAAVPEKIISETDGRQNWETYLLALCRIHPIHFSHGTVLGGIGRNNINFISIVLDPV